MSHDLEAEIIEENNFVPTKNNIKKILSNFEGEIFQRPQNILLLRLMVKEHIILLEKEFFAMKEETKIMTLLLDHKNNKTEFSTTVGKGFYIRSLMKICEKLGV